MFFASVFTAQRRGPPWRRRHARHRQRDQAPLGEPYRRQRQHPFLRRDYVQRAGVWPGALANPIQKLPAPLPCLGSQRRPVMVKPDLRHLEIQQLEPVGEPTGGQKARLPRRRFFRQRSASQRPARAPQTPGIESGDYQMAVADQHALHFPQQGMRIGTEFQRQWQQRHIDAVALQGQRFRLCPDMSNASRRQRPMVPDRAAAQFERAGVVTETQQVITECTLQPHRQLGFQRALELAAGRQLQPRTRRVDVTANNGCVHALCTCVRLSAGTGARADEMTTVTRAFTMLHVTGIPASYDNYIWLLARPGESRVTIIDPSNAEPVLAHLAQHQLVLDSILVTHHHRDHIGGLTALKAATGARVYGPAIERVADCDVALTEGDVLDLPHLAQRLQVLAVPGHVREHIAFYGDGRLFCGDTLFLAGCGRIFTGTAEQLFASLQRLAQLPPDTAIYCSHEYTEANLRFARTVEPDHAGLAARVARAQALRAQGIPTVPGVLQEELASNPFLRCHEPGLQAAVARETGVPITDSLSCFAALREWKNRFR